MKKKTKVNKKRLDSLLLVLLLTAVLMIMSTYAWFTANRTVTIGAIDVHVATSAGLQISADGENWSTDISIDDILKAYNESSTKYNHARYNQIPNTLEPVSTNLTQNGAFLNMHYGVTQQSTTNSSTYFLYTDNTQLKDEGSEGFNGGKYVAFDVFLKSGSPESELYMSGSVEEVAKVVSGGSTSYTTVSESEERGIENSTRIAVIKGEHETDSDDVSTIRGLSTAGGTVMMWEPNYDAHTKEAIENAIAFNWGTETTTATGKKAITIDTVGSTVTVGAETSQPYLPYYGIKSAIPEPTTSGSPPVMSGFEIKDSYKAHATYLDLVTPTWKTPKGAKHSLQFPKAASVVAGAGDVGIDAGVTLYRIYMWIEGQDLDCENAASGSYVEYKLEFSLNALANVQNYPSP